VAGFYAPHTPVNPPQQFVDLYDESEMPLPQRNDGENFENTSDEQWRKTKAYYYALVSHVDDQVGRILDSLENNGILEETLVVFTSDHGENLGDHGRIQKHQAWDSSSRVPLIIRPPRAHWGEPKTAVSQEIVELVDLAPTILDFAAVQTPRVMQGRSLTPVILGEKDDTESRKSAFIEYRLPRGDAYKAIRTKDHLYVLHNSGSEELYDLVSDPHQLTNVVNQPGDKSGLGRLRQEMLKRWFEIEGKGPQRSGPY